MTPRLLVGTIGSARAARGAGDLASALERAGHTVIALDPDDPGQVAHVDLVIIDVAVPAAVRSLAARLAPYARPRQMFVHTALLGGAQLLDEVETSRAIVMCAHRLGPATWVTSAADELGEGVIAMLIAEAGAVAIPVADAVRPTLAAAQELRSLKSSVLLDAHSLLTSAIPNLPPQDPELGLSGAAPDAEHPAGTAGTPGAADTPGADGTASAADPASPPDPTGPASAAAFRPTSQAFDIATLDVLYDAIDDPGIRGLFVDLQRRTAEQAGDAAVQVWAMEKYEGRTR